MHNLMVLFSMSAKELKGASMNTNMKLKEGANVVSVKLLVRFGLVESLYKSVLCYEILDQLDALEQEQALLFIPDTYLLL